MKKSSILTIPGSAKRVEAKNVIDLVSVLKKSLTHSKAKAEQGQENPSTRRNPRKKSTQRNKAA